MFWDRISPLYDLFENIYNHRVYAGTGKKVAEFIDPTDTVLECACGTGAITVCIAGKCRRLMATDCAPGMLYLNITIKDLSAIIGQKSNTKGRRIRKCSLLSKHTMEKENLTRGWRSVPVTWRE